MKEMKHIPDEVFQDVIPCGLNLMEQLHAKRILHRDFHLKNILVKRDGHLILADFGRTKHFSSGTITKTLE